jgi:hypothetical protein
MSKVSTFSACRVMCKNTYQTQFSPTACEKNAFTKTCSISWSQRRQFLPSLKKFENVQKMSLEQFNLFGVSQRPRVFPYPFPLVSQVFCRKRIKLQPKKLLGLTSWTTRLRGAEVKVVLFVPVVSGSNPRRLWRHEISDALDVFITLLFWYLLPPN